MNLKLKEYVELPNLGGTNRENFLKEDLKFVKRRQTVPKYIGIWIRSLFDYT